jgi:hypothetical protein
VVILFFWDPEASAPDNKSERSLLVETLEVLLQDSSRNAISSLFPVPPSLVGSLPKCVTQEPKKKNLALVGASVGSHA